MIDLGLVVWPPNGTVQSVVALIGLVWLAGVRAAWAAHCRVRDERAHVAAVRDKLGLLGDGVGLPAVLGRSSASLAVRLARGMVGHRGLANARAADVLDPLADEAARVVLTARAFPNFLLLLGLLATILGLAFTLAEVAPDIERSLSSAGADGVATSLGRTLSEMRGAFAGTLWGVAAALTLQGFTSWVAARADRLVAELEALGVALAPHVYPAGTEQHLASLQEMLAEGRRFYDETQGRIRETSEEFKKVLGAASSLIASSLKTLETTSTDVGKSLMRASGDVLASSEQLTRAAKALEGYQGELRNTYSMFSEMFERSMQQLKGQSDDQLAHIRDLQREFGDAGGAVVERLLGTSELLRDTTGELKSGAAAYLQGTQEVTTSIRAGFDHLNDRLREVLDAYTAEVAAVSAHLGGLTARVGEGTEATGLLVKTLRDKDATELTRHRDRQAGEQRVVTAVASIKQAIADLEPTLSVLRDAPATVAGAIDAARDGLAGELERLREDLAAQAADRRELVEAARESGEALLYQSALARESLEASRGLRAWLEARGDEARDALKRRGDEGAARAERAERLTGQLVADLQALRGDVVGDRGRASAALDDVVRQLQALAESGSELQRLTAALPTSTHADQMIEQQAQVARHLAAAVAPLALGPAPNPEPVSAG